MNFLFSRTYKYTINKPIDNVLQDFSKVANKKWTDFSENIKGTLYDDNTFKFTHKWTLGYMHGIFGNGLATIKGSINNNGQNTVIEITLRPNFGLVLFIYMIAIIFLYGIFNIKTMINGPKTSVLLLILSWGSYFMD